MKFRLQVNTTGDWRDVIGGGDSRLNAVMHAVNWLAAVDPEARWSLLYSDGSRRSFEVLPNGWQIIPTPPRPGCEQQEPER